MQRGPENANDQDDGHFASKSSTYLAGSFSRPHEGTLSFSVVRPDLAVAPHNSVELRQIAIKTTRIAYEKTMLSLACPDIFGISRAAINSRK